MVFALCVWAVHKATCPPTQANTSYGMMHVYHKASVTEGGEDGVAWWTRACSTDREAIVLLKSEDADPKTRAATAGLPSRAPRPCIAT